MSDKTCKERYLRDNSETKRNLIRIIQSLPDSSKIDAAILDAALDRALRETNEEFEDFQLLVLDRILWHFFAGESGLWVGCRTREGNIIPADMLINAYTMWRSAAAYAENRGVDEVKAASAMVKAVHIAVDNMAKGHPIEKIRKYLFGIYRHNISRITRKPTFAYKKKRVELTEKRLADKGIYLSKIEDKMLCRELMEFMPPQGKRVASLRYRFGYDWKETARQLNTSVNAVQKALSVGIQKAFDAYMKKDGRGSSSGNNRRKNPRY